MICCAQHITRCGERDPERWQTASQLVTHALLRDAGFTLPPEAEAWEDLSVEQAQRMAQKLLGKVASADDPAPERAEARDMPTLAQAFQDYLGSNPRRKPRTVMLRPLTKRLVNHARDDDITEEYAADR